MEDAKSINYHIVSNLQTCSEYEFRVQVLLNGSRPGPFSAAVKTETITVSKFFIATEFGRQIACSGLLLVVESEKRQDRKNRAGFRGFRGRSERTPVSFFKQMFFPVFQILKTGYGGGTQRHFIESRLHFGYCVIVTRLGEFPHVKLLPANCISARKVPH